MLFTYAKKKYIYIYILHAKQFFYSFTSTYREVDDKKKPSLKVDPEAKRMGDCLKSKVDQLSSELEKNIIENSKMQDYKRTLQACIQNIEAPRQISQECLHHRESRYSWLLFFFIFHLVEANNFTYLLCKF